MQATESFRFPILAPSLIAADGLNLEKEIHSCLELGLPWLHCDIMDGHFVPNITLGPDLIQEIKKKFPAILCDVHLMVSASGFWVSKFIEAGASVITVHVENTTGEDIALWSRQCETANVIFGLAIRPTTSLEVLKPWISLIKLVNVMSVYPGFYGQTYLAGSEDRIRTVRSWVPNKENLWIKVDGGVNVEIAKLCCAAGADILVMGGAFFKAKDRKAVAKAIDELRR